MSIKSGRGRLSSTNSLTEKTLRYCPCEYAAWSPSCQSPTCQSPAAIRPSPDFESIAWYVAISEIWSQSRSRLHFCCGKHRPWREPLNRAGLVRNNHNFPSLPAHAASCCVGLFGHDAVSSSGVTASPAPLLPAACRDTWTILLLGRSALQLIENHFAMLLEAARRAHRAVTPPSLTAGPDQARLYDYTSLART